tara:strand:- start:20107 stop:20331 length:225 start_codon:yes stop_codon:yes gene_type:complete
MASFKDADINKAARSLLKSSGSGPQSLAVEGDNFVKKRKGETEAQFASRKRAFIIAARKRRNEMEKSARSADLN